MAPPDASRILGENEDEAAGLSSEERPHMGDKVKNLKGVRSELGRC